MHLIFAQDYAIRASNCKRIRHAITSRGNRNMITDSTAYHKYSDYEIATSLRDSQ